MLMRRRKKMVINGTVIAEVPNHDNNDGNNTGNIDNEAGHGDGDAHSDQGDVDGIVGDDPIHDDHDHVGDEDGDSGTAAPSSRASWLRTRRWLVVLTMLCCVYIAMIVHHLGF